MKDFQFYQTPRPLAERAWRKFKDKDFSKVLESSAGTGELAEAFECLFQNRFHRRDIVKVDCCEIDPSKHAVLREKGFNVVGLDFLQFGDGSIYSHVLMNPPFAEGVKHVLKAWDMMWDGEIVAIINAETVRNLCSAERELLASLIERHGEVEFIEEAFAGPDAQRKTSVEVALVYLCKKADAQKDIFGTLFDDLRNDHATKSSLSRDFKEDLMPALPNTSIENAVLAFTAAARSMRDAVFAQSRASYYCALLGETMAVLNAGGTTAAKKSSVEGVQAALAEKYDELKDRAWTCILRSTNVTKHLSSAAQRRLESEFERIKKLEFTVSNIYGFLCGLMEKQGEIQIEMACDIFDSFTRYHSDNTVFFRGWKSNDRHSTCGMRLRTTRVVLPGHKSSSYQSGLYYESERLLADFDKVFAMLDGKREPELGLVEVFRQNFRELRGGERISSSYFDVRYYPGVGTIHFFARDKKLVDRLNRLVGRHRQWLPPEGERVSEGFWLQYESAEKFDKELRAEISKRAPRNYFGWMGPMAELVSREPHAERGSVADKLFDEASTAVLERHGISTDFRIETEVKETLLLAAA